MVGGPSLFIWMLWNERNRMAFENETPSALRMKSSFCSPYGRGLSCIVLIT